MRDPSEDELDALMSRLSQGDRGAFDPLFRALHPRAVRMAKLGLPQDQAADAAQSMLMKVFARASEFEAGRPVLPWFYAIAANELHTVRRRGARLRQRHVDEHHGHQVAAAGERLLLHRELRHALERAIAALDDDSAEAIASMLNEVERPIIGASAFRKRVSRAYAKLRLLLGGVDAK